MSFVSTTTFFGVDNTGVLFLSLVELLKTHGANKLKTCTANTFMFHAVIRETLVVQNLENNIQGLLDRRADPSVKDSNGMIQLDVFKDSKVYKQESNLSMY